VQVKIKGTTEKRRQFKMMHGREDNCVKMGIKLEKKGLEK